MHITVDDLNGPEIQALLQEHLDDMYTTSPPESVHALDLRSLRKPNITFWTIWDNTELLGCGALKTHDSKTGEIKSMRTARGHLRKGIARKMLNNITQTAKQKGIERLYLETGSMAYFGPARSLYVSEGFGECGPFGDYVEDPNSVFMVKVL
jgi:putative acetyltransferase